MVHEALMASATSFTLPMEASGAGLALLSASWREAGCAAAGAVSGAEAPSPAPTFTEAGNAAGSSPSGWGRCAAAAGGPEESCAPEASSAVGSPLRRTPGAGCMDAFSLPGTGALSSATGAAGAFSSPGARTVASSKGAVRSAEASLRAACTAFQSSCSNSQAGVPLRSLPMFSPRSDTNCSQLRACTVAGSKAGASPSAKASAGTCPRCLAPCGFASPSAPRPDSAGTVLTALSVLAGPAEISMEAGPASADAGDPGCDGVADSGRLTGSAASPSPPALLLCA